MTNLDKANARAWSNYWETGFESTFTQHGDTELFAHLDQFWTQIFETAETNAMIVDLGAGNGALTAQIVEIGRRMEKGFTVIAVDYADIRSRSPIFERKDPSLEIKAFTPIEDTGLEAASADLCVSQFGYEYADHERASSELYRILKPAGRFTAVIHHRQSEVTQSCASAHMQIRLCQRSELTMICSKLIRRLQKLAKSHRSPQQDEIAEELRQELNKRVERVIEYGSRMPDQHHINYFINELTGLFRPEGKKLSFSKQLSIIEDVESNSENFQLRMEAMLKASLDEDGFKELQAALSNVGLDILVAEPMWNAGKLYGWRLTAEKPAENIENA